MGAIGIGRIKRGRVSTNMPISIIAADGSIRKGRVLQVLGFRGLERSEVPEAFAGNIVAVTGIDKPRISDTICDPNCIEALPALTVDEPTVTMTFQVNNSPFAGREGKYVTSRQIKERLDRELIANVALRVATSGDADHFVVSGRGELHLSILIENMRREGYELAVSRPQVVKKEIDGVLCEPYEELMVDVEEEHQGGVMQDLAERRGQLKHMEADGKGRIRLDYTIPTRGLIGFHSRFLTQTSGSGIMHHIFDHFGPVKQEPIKGRGRGVMVSMCAGKATGYSLYNLQERGAMFIGPQTEVYEGMIVAINSRDNDLVVNVTKGKQLTNIRASGSD